MSDPANNQPLPLSDETQRRGALVLRALPILLIPVFAAIATVVVLRFTVGDQFRPPDSDRGGPPFGPLIPIVVLVIFCSSLILLVRLGRPTLSALALIGAWTLITTLTSLPNGVTTIFPALLIVPICAAGLLIDGVASVSLAVLATLLVGSMAFLEMNGVITPRPPPPFMAANLPTISVGFWIGLFWTVAALTSLLAGGLQRALKQSRTQAHALRELSAQLEARVETQTARLLDQEREAATLEERARLAREIHDTLAQGLTGIVVQLGAAQRALTAAPEDADQHIDLAQRMARESLAEARRSVWNLRAPALERGDLADALRSLATWPLRPSVTVGFEQRGDPYPLPPSIESALLRVGQEALVNVAKHANATHADVLLEYTHEDVRLSISDDGIGFAEPAPPNGAPPGPWGGFGLLGMRERITVLGGTLDLTSNGGAQVVATVPRDDKVS